MRLEIKEFEPSTVILDGSQTLEPSNRLNRSSRRFNRRFARRFASRTTPPEDFSPFPVARWEARPEHSREAMGPPLLEIASRGEHELGSVGLGDTAISRPSRARTGRPEAGATPLACPDRVVVASPGQRRLIRCQRRTENARNLAVFHRGATRLLPTRVSSDRTSGSHRDRQSEIFSGRRGRERASASLAPRLLHDRLLGRGSRRQAVTVRAWLSR